MSDPTIIRSEKIVLTPIDEIKPNPLNKNTHPEDQIERLAKIIEYQGFRSPLIVSSLTGMLVSGHGRLLAAKKLGLKELPVMVQEFDSPEMEYAAMVSENSIASWAELDFSGINTDLQHLDGTFDIDLLGIRNFVLEPADKLDTGDEDAVPPEPTVAITKMGDVWRLGNHTLMCGDSTNIQAVEHLMGGEKADMVFTDPPYGIEHSGKGITGSAVKGNFGEILGDSDVTVAVDAFNLVRAMLPDSRLIFWGANYYCSSLPNGFGWLVWDKEREGNVFSGAELAFVNQGVKLDVFRHMWHGMVKASEMGQARVHPTQKPIALAEWCFDNYGKPNTVLDLFGGSGSTLIACEKTNRKCFMMELSEKYCDVIISRYAQFTGKDPVRDDGAKWSEL